MGYPTGLVLPLINGVYEWLAEDNDDDDVITLKNFLRPLGYGRSGPATCFADQKFLDDIRRYQKDRGLKVDGVVAPVGETSRSIAQDFSEKTHLLSEGIETWQDVDDEWGEDEHGKRCAFSLLTVDLPSCEGQAKALEKRLIRQGRKPGYARQQGRQFYATCEQQAYDRYAACLRDHPAKDFDKDRPPLPWANQLEGLR
ncbi:MAG: peptidoglycan-binding domain-containing protein [Alphaproteobacteria bacterium]|jgi:hypothetical protein